eukprot:GGOE01033485.1.p1 GENE.GGOE01033485.1~~GGOE01033485.1.p1  ORF type:complete len:230 (+),score=1.10 GGOE01033485.1:278-967(+)
MCHSRPLYSISTAILFHFNRYILFMFFFTFWLYLQPLCIIVYFYNKFHIIENSAAPPHPTTCPPALVSSGGSPPDRHNPITRPLLQQSRFAWCMPPAPQKRATLNDAMQLPVELTASLEDGGPRLSALLASLHPFASVIPHLPSLLLLGSRASPPAQPSPQADVSPLSLCGMHRARECVSKPLPWFPHLLSICPSEGQGRTPSSHSLSLSLSLSLPPICGPETSSLASP